VDLVTTLDSRGPLPTREQLRAHGREMRTACPRREQAGWEPAPGRQDPVEAIRAGDRGRVPELLAIRHGRMAVSPFTFLRGTAGIMAADLAHTPHTGITPWLCGDAHLLNFGLYASPERSLVFDVNDFDEAHPGPWEWDVKRLAASAAVGARSEGFSDLDARGAAQAVGRGYRLAIQGLADAPWLEIHHVHEEAHQIPSRIFSKGARRTLARTVHKAEMRTNDQALRRFALQDEDGSWAFREQPPLLTRLPHEDAVQLGTALIPYVQRLSPDVADLFDRYRARDAAFKVVGVGSVGLRAYVMMLTGAGPEDALFLQIKEAVVSVVGRHAPWRPALTHQGERVVTGQRRLQAVSDEFLGFTTIGSRHFYVRQLRDMKGSVDIAALSAADLAAYASLCGRMLAKSHARSGSPASIAGYLGTSDRMDEALADFAMRYADQTERDHAALVAAIARGDLDAESGV
jgi:uncharacterized protein (DUF2252 family)